MSETKTCNNCGKKFPATTEHFYTYKYKEQVKLKAICRKCESERGKRNYLKDKDNIQKRHRENHNKNKDKYNAQSRDHYANGGGKESKSKYYQENIGSIKLKRAVYRQNNKGLIHEQNQKWYYGNGGKEKVATYRANNRKKISDAYNKYYHSESGRNIILTIVNRRWSKKQKLLSTLTPEEWLETLNHFDNSCAYCGTTEADLHRDHVLPLSKGGFYVQSNLVPACQKCNSSKHANDLNEWFRSQPFFTEQRLTKIIKWTGLKPNSKIQQPSMF